LEYKPIDCNFYDLLEACCTLRKQVKIIYLSEDQTHTVYDIIQDLYTKEHIEYMVLASGLTLRIDQLLEVDGKLVPGIC
jgi:Rho-binding antiterminator